MSRLVCVFLLFFVISSYAQEFKYSRKEIEKNEVILDSIKISNDSIYIVKNKKHGSNPYKFKKKFNNKVILHYYMVKSRYLSNLEHTFWDYSKPILLYVSDAYPKPYHDSIKKLVNDLNALEFLNIKIIDNQKKANISVTIEDQMKLLFKNIFDMYKKYPELEQFDMMKHICHKKIADRDGKIQYTNIRMNLKKDKSSQEKKILKLKRNLFLAITGFGTTYLYKKNNSYTNLNYTFDGNLSEFDKDLFRLHYLLTN